MRISGVIVMFLMSGIGYVSIFTYFYPICSQRQCVAVAIPLAEAGHYFEQLSIEAMKLPSPECKVDTPSPRRGDGR